LDLNDSIKIRLLSRKPQVGYSILKSGAGSLLRLVRRVGGLGLGFHACLILLRPEKERQTSLSERDGERRRATEESDGCQPEDMRR